MLLHADCLICCMNTYSSQYSLYRTPYFKTLWYHADQVYILKFVVPRAPTSLLVTPPKGTCTQLHVRWNSSPQQPDCPANVRYRVFRDGRVIYDLLSSNSTIFNNLIPNKQYQVKIVAHNGLGDGGNVVTMGTTRSQGTYIRVYIIY